MRRCFHRPKATTPGDVQCTVLTSRERLRPDKPRLPQRDSLERQAAAMVTDPLEQAVRDRLVDKGRHPAAGSCSAAATSATEKSRPTMAAALLLGPDVLFPAIPDPPPGYITRITPQRIGGVGPWNLPGR
jgi:hypothetical protein